MGLDKANIFKLDNKELENYKTDPFLDCFESTKDFAKALKNDIDTKETPHSLLLSADYGMGKTFFSTRFVQYLRNNRYDVIYFSAWENDYLQEPFIAFSKAIVSYIHNKFKAERYKANISKLFDITQNIVSSVTLSFGRGISLSAEQLIDTFKTEIDPIIEFRKQLTSFINKIPKKKLILIIDELDRCRPDYAMKTLECIKHFFDIEGLFIIVPTNKAALNDCIKSLYGIDNQKRHCKENYFQKFFNDERILKRPIDRDYLYIVGQYLTSTRLEEALSKKLLSEDKNCYNSIILLRNWFATFSYNAGLSVRELKDFSIELARICNNFYEPIRVEWLACVFANRNIPKDTNYVYPIPREHCFYCEAYKDIEHSTNGKNNIFNLSEYTPSFTSLEKLTNGMFQYNYDLCNSYNALIRSLQKIPSGLKKYLDIFNFLDENIAQIVNFESKYTLPQKAKDNFKILKDAIARQKAIIEQYQSRYGSDDNDSVRRQTYINIVQNPETLYSTTCS